MLLRHRLLNLQALSTPLFSTLPSKPPLGPVVSFRRPVSLSAVSKHPPSPPLKRAAGSDASSSGTAAAVPPELARKALFVPPGVVLEEVTEDMVLPGTNIVIGPYAGDAQIKQVEFVKSSARPRDCPKDDRPEFAILGRSNVGKSSLINALVRKKEFALTSKKPGKTQLINHFLINKSWYIVDLPGYGASSLLITSGSLKHPFKVKPIIHA